MADKDRVLTGAGIEKMKRAAAGLVAAQAIPDVVLSSPLVRARQTAEILVEACGGKPLFKIASALAPAGNRTELYGAIRQHAEVEGVMIVGHEPSLSAIACEILSGSPGSFMNLKKGGACAIGIVKMSPAPSGILYWFMPPAILRRLG
jgi:phosphohistidine phosphatase